MENAHLRCWDKALTLYEVRSQVYLKNMDNIFLSVYCLLCLTVVSRHRFELFLISALIYFPKFNYVYYYVYYFCKWKWSLRKVDHSVFKDFK